ncbi:MSCS-like 3 isoform 1 [Hibiscus syriacus]|uniref:O-fucosyltransferase family protein n=1 Tax=Hibiscus syriacus TaxID=106335 RepID=A0A6A2WHN4_HIBSY|nr:MSCS-like 3 isoform 1 [Hibiscus syriacus]
MEVQLGQTGWSIQVQLGQTGNSLNRFKLIELVIPYGPKVTLGGTSTHYENLQAAESIRKIYDAKRIVPVQLSTSVGAPPTSLRSTIAKSLEPLKSRLWRSFSAIPRRRMASAQFPFSSIFPKGEGSLLGFQDFDQQSKTRTILVQYRIVRRGSRNDRGVPIKQRSDLWSPLPNQGWKPCIDSADNPPSLPERSEGYIQVFLDGGLNQQRMGICDAVAVAQILNATLVIPHLEVNSVWQDSSSFTDTFDMDHFSNVLRDEVSIVKELPRQYSWSTREYYATGIRATRIKTATVHASADWYVENMLPVIQRFIGESLVHRLRYPSGKLQDLGSEDMAAHSACDFGGGKAEKLALAKYRQVLWQGRVLNSQFTDNELRNQGRCPIDSRGDWVYGGEARISTLCKMFLLMEDKKSLASAKELAKVEGKASLMATVDYYVSLQSDIFISASPGNMHNALTKHVAAGPSIHTYPAPDCMCRA